MSGGNQRELQIRAKQLAERLSESAHILDHDPSMALYRLQEHMNKMVPRLVIRKCQMGQLNAQLQGACFDLDNAIKTIDQMKRAEHVFHQVLEGLNRALTQGQQDKGRAHVTDDDFKL